MRTVEQITKICWHSRDIVDIEKTLKQWAEEIINQCANKLSDDGAIQEGWLWQKILKTKEEL